MNSFFSLENNIAVFSPIIFDFDSKVTIPIKLSFVKRSFLARRIRNFHDWLCKGMLSNKQSLSMFEMFNLKVISFIVRNKSTSFLLENQRLLSDNRIMASSSGSSCSCAKSD